MRPITGPDVATRYYALSVPGGQGGAVDEITAAQPPGGATAPARGVDAGALVKAVRTRNAADSGMGSNAVAFSGATTANGRGLPLGNPHYLRIFGQRSVLDHVLHDEGRSQALDAGELGELLVVELLERGQVVGGSLRRCGRLMW